MRPTPFTILIDTAEQLPFSFEGLRTDADHEHELWDVKTERVCLGRHPNSLGDYSVAGGEGKVAVERKSVADLQNTLLGFNDGHRARFEKELANLNEIEAGLVVVEGHEIDVVLTAPEYGIRPREHNAKTLDRTIDAYLMDFDRVRWMFCANRAWAEYRTFHWLRRWHEIHMKKRRAEIRAAEASRRAAARKKLAELNTPLEAKLDLI